MYSSPPLVSPVLCSIQELLILLCIAFLFPSCFVHPRHGCNHAFLCRYLRIHVLSRCCAEVGQAFSNNLSDVWFFSYLRLSAKLLCDSSTRVCKNFIASWQRQRLCQQDCKTRVYLVASAACQVALARIAELPVAPAVACVCA